MNIEDIKERVNLIKQECEDILTLLTSDIDPYLPPEADPSNTVIDCLAGPYPGYVNMYSDELMEGAWLSKKENQATNALFEKEGKLLLIGDSMIERGDFSPLGDHLNHGISGESIRQLYYRIGERGRDSYIHRCGGCVILTGINDLSDPRNGDFKNKAETVNFVYGKLSDRITGKVVIIKPIYVDDTVFSVPDKRAVKMVGDHIDELFKDRDDVTVLDVNPLLAPNDSLLPEYHVDGQHLSDKGYKILINEIKKVL